VSEAAQPHGGDSDAPPGSRSPHGAADAPPELDTRRIRTVPIARRPNKVRSDEFAQPPGADLSFAAFAGSLPDVLQARAFMDVVAAMADAARARRGVLAMLGGHVVKTGLAPVLIDLMERGAVTHIATNGSAVIHDYEMARWGGTSEDVEAGLSDGSFGMAEETGREMNAAITAGAAAGQGMGESLARALEAASELAHPELSLLLAARRLRVGVTVHAAIGAEIIHQHPGADGAAIGATSYTDFKRLAAYLPRIEGGVVLNLGSAVIMPEVFLKALTMSRNVHAGAPRAFTAADFDMIRHYRPRMNVVERPTRSGGGQGYQITGPHELLVPLLAWAVALQLDG
jgi:hypothetical protein